jgi:release factor glutamine methyltransferase
MLLREVKNIFHTELDPLYPKEEINSFFSLLIEHYLNLEQFALALQPDLIVSKEKEIPLFEALSRLKLKEPIQYIIGYSHFMEMDFTVSKDVLIPRPETEELVWWILDDCQKNPNQPLKILDIGTGSGCIAISLAKNLNKAEVFALDISEDALEIAKSNALLNGVEITCINKNILVDKLDSMFDIIISNPPYVRELEKKDMNENVLDHEPAQALFVTDEDPLVFYKKITSISSKHLIKGGALFFEINQYLGKETEQLLKDHDFSEIELRKDMFGNNRMLKGKLK